MDEDGVFQPSFWNTLFLSERPSWKPVSAFVPWSDECPHVMFTIEHEIEENENLLREENSSNHCNYTHQVEAVCLCRAYLHPSKRAAFCPFPPLIRLMVLLGQVLVFLVHGKTSVGGFFRRSSMELRLLLKSRSSITSLLWIRPGTCSSFSCGRWLVLRLVAPRGLA